MSDVTRQKAKAALTDAEAVTASRLPEPETAAKIAQDDVTRIMAELDMSDTRTIIRFGTKAQGELQAISQQMLAGVHSKDVGPAGASLREMVTALRGFAVDEMDPNTRPSWWQRILGRARPAARAMAKFEKVQGQIDRITDDLLGHETVLLKDIRSLDLLYEKTLDFYGELALYIAAGEARLAQLDSEDIPAKRAAANTAPENEAVLMAQELRDLRAARDDLERRVHDLKLTRQVTMQSLPSIRLVQENDKSLVTKINSTLVNTVPLWETQLAQALTIHRGREAAGAVRDANDLTNDLLRQNAANLKTANREIRTEMERGVFDIEAVTAANEQLIATIEESLQIADEGKARRAAAELDLDRMEAQLTETLTAAKTANGDRPGSG